MAALLLAAGFETTTLLLANALVALLNHRDQADRLRTRPELAQAAVEELLRYDSPVQLLSSRSAPVDLQVGGSPGGGATGHHPGRRRQPRSGGVALSAPPVPRDGLTLHGYTSLPVSAY